MKNIYSWFIYLLILVVETASAATFKAHNPVPLTIKERIMDVSWKQNCPISLDDLAYLKISFWGYDDQEHVGELIVHKRLAQEVLEIFKEMYEFHFPIERMRLIDEYDADDNASMSDNNTSALCVREITHKLGMFSNHSYGIAIDINPITNPYVKGNCVIPAAGGQFLDRESSAIGIITANKNNICYMAFTKRGWNWGGSWYAKKGYVDYQHFSKKIEGVPYIY